MKVSMAKGFLLYGRQRKTMKGLMTFFVLERVIVVCTYLNIRSNHNLLKIRSSPWAWSNTTVFFSSLGRAVNTRLPMDPSPVNFLVIRIGSQFNVLDR